MATTAGRPGAVDRLCMDLWQVLILAAADDPTLTVEDELYALATAQTRLIQSLRGIQGHPAASTPSSAAPAPSSREWKAPFPPPPKRLTAWANAYKNAAAEASRCPVCNTDPNHACRCYVPPEQRPDPVPAALLTAVYPLIAAYLGEVNGRA